MPGRFDLALPGKSPTVMPPPRGLMCTIVTSKYLTVSPKSLSGFSICTTRTESTVTAAHHRANAAPTPAHAYLQNLFLLGGGGAVSRQVRTQCGGAPVRLYGQPWRAQQRGGGRVLPRPLRQPAVAIYSRAQRASIAAPHPPCQPSGAGKKKRKPFFDQNPIAKTSDIGKGGIMIHDPCLSDP